MGQIKLVNARTGTLKGGLLDLIADLPSGLVMAEIGCYIGDSALLFMESGKVKTFYAIDTWRPERFANAEKEFIRRTSKYDNLFRLKMTINEAANQLPKLDFIYIDADHSYLAVKNDISCSLPILKENGIIAGHDYSSPRYSTMVVRAVDELLGKPDKIYIDTSWLIKL